jgi:hypothetical protein
MNQALYAHMNNKRKMKKKKTIVHLKGVLRRFKNNKHEFLMQVSGPE